MSSTQIRSVGLVALALSTAASLWLLGFSVDDWAAISACGTAALMAIAGVAGLERNRCASAGALTVEEWSMGDSVPLGLAQAGAAFLAYVAVSAAGMLLAVVTTDWRSHGPLEIGA